MKTIEKKQLVKMPLRKSNRYNVEYFHIYTDEVITKVHTTSLEYLKELQVAWNFEISRVVMIDNYNPTVHITNSEEVLSYLKKENLEPEYWAFEADLVKNAQTLLENITSAKIKRQYTQYIEARGKYPCSLLTASWYLTRLGELDGSVIKTNGAEPSFIPGERLINILPEQYREVEQKALKIIKNSTFKESADKVQALFYPASFLPKAELF